MVAWPVGNWVSESVELSVVLVIVRKLETSSLVELCSPVPAVQPCRSTNNHHPYTLLGHDCDTAKICIHVTTIVLCVSITSLSIQNLGLIYAILSEIRKSVNRPDSEF